VCFGAVFHSLSGTRLRDVTFVGSCVPPRVHTPRGDPERRGNDAGVHKR